MTRKETDQLFYSITSNGCREMNKVRFHQAINEALIMSNVVDRSELDRSEQLKCGFNRMQKWFGKYYENLIIIIALTVVLILNLDL